MRHDASKRAREEQGKMAGQVSETEKFALLGFLGKVGDDALFELLDDPLSKTADAKKAFIKEVAAAMGAQRLTGAMPLTPAEKLKQHVAVSKYY